MEWKFFNDIATFIGYIDKSVWQDVLLSAILIPIGLKIAEFLHRFWNKTRPRNMLLHGYLDSSTEVLLYLAQLSAIDSKGEINVNQKYVGRYSSPIPTNKYNFGVNNYQNVDPVWSESDGECLADVFNVLGSAGKITKIIVADLIKDWGRWSHPTFSIGFNPKTLKFIEKCDPIYFNIDENNSLALINSEERLSCRFGYDACIIQKTFIKNTNVPVFILAGLGTVGTSAAGYYLRENSIELGKMYGDKSFCILLKTRFDEGRTSSVVQSIYPEPGLRAKIFHPIVYNSFVRSKNIVKESKGSILNIINKNFLKLIAFLKASSSQKKNEKI